MNDTDGLVSVAVVPWWFAPLLVVAVYPLIAWFDQRPVSPWGIAVTALGVGGLVAGPLRRRFEYEFSGDRLRWHTWNGGQGDVGLTALTACHQSRVRGGRYTLLEFETEAGVSSLDELYAGRRGFHQLKKELELRGVVPTRHP